MIGRLGGSSAIGSVSGSGSVWDTSKTAARRNSVRLWGLARLGVEDDAPGLVVLVDRHRREDADAALALAHTAVELGPRAEAGDAGCLGTLQGDQELVSERIGAKAPSCLHPALPLDIRYALLLGFVEHYLVTTGGLRRILAAWIFAEMRSHVGFMARQLTTMPRAGADPTGSVAAAPFTLPPVLHLPDDDGARWALHRERTETAIAKVEEMRASDETDRADPYLDGLLASDRARLAFIDAGATPLATSFARDILPLFRPKDIDHMTDLNLDLSEYEVVRSKARAIAQRVAAAGGRPMPPAPDQRWTKVQIELFEQWVAEEFPE